MKKTFFTLIALLSLANCNIAKDEAPKIKEAKVHYSLLVPFYNTCVQKAEEDGGIVGEAYCMCCTNLVRNEMTLGEFLAFGKQAQADQEEGVNALTTVEANEKFKSIVYRCVEHLQAPLEIESESEKNKE